MTWRTPAQRLLLYVGLHGTDDPTLATLPFLVATGATTAEIDCCITRVGEGALLAPPGMIDAVHEVGFPPLAELWQKVKNARRSRPTFEAAAPSPVG